MENTGRNSTLRISVRYDGNTLHHSISNGFPDLPGTGFVALLTDSRIITFSTRDLRVQWDMPLTSVAGVQGEHEGIRFNSKLGKDYDKLLGIQDTGSREWFFNQVKDVVLAFNARKRLER